MGIFDGEGDMLDPLGSQRAFPVEAPHREEPCGVQPPIPAPVFARLTLVDNMCRGDDDLRADDRAGATVLWSARQVLPDSAQCPEGTCKRNRRLRPVQAEVAYVAKLLILCHRRAPSVDAKEKPVCLKDASLALHSAVPEWDDVLRPCIARMRVPPIRGRRDRI